MPRNRSVDIGGDATGNVITTGDKNKIRTKIKVVRIKTPLPPAESIDIAQELAQIRAILARVAGEQAGKVGRALDDAAEEAGSAKPNKDEVGSALGRALDYAKKGSAFADEVQKLAPHVTNAVAWLGANWHQLLSVVGLAL